MTFRFSIVFLLLATGAALGCEAAGGGLELETCRLATGRPALCGTLTVPENRAAPDGRSIDLNIVVLSALAAEPEADPILFLHGGPGGAATYAAPMFATSELRRHRDIVLVDQRGTGGSNPLECDDEADLRSMLRGNTFDVAGIETCRAELNADPRFYTTSVVVEDLEAVRQAYGASRVNLIGGSYGTRLALDYMRLHPKSIRAVMLRGVAPPPYSIGEDFDHDSLRALNLVLEDCAADETCAAAFPRLRAELDETLERLESEPGAARVRDPFGDGDVSVPVTRELFAASVHYALYLKQTAARLPAMIHRAHAGDFDDLVGNVVTLSVALAPQMSTGAFLSVACAEDAPFVDVDAVVREARNTLLQGMFSVNLARMCEHWDVPAVPAEFKQHVRSVAPVLLISGDADPVTPPRWAEEALRHLPNGKHVVLPETGHGDLAPGCVAGLVARLFETASTSDLDVECASRVGRPRFE